MIIEDLFCLSLSLTCCWNGSEIVYIQVWKQNSSEKALRWSFRFVLPDCSFLQSLHERWKSYISCQIWNSLPLDIKHLKTALWQTSRQTQYLATYQNKQDHVMSTRLSVFKVVRQWTVSETSDMQLGLGKVRTQGLMLKYRTEKKHASGWTAENILRR